MDAWGGQGEREGERKGGTDPERSSVNSYILHFSIGHLQLVQTLQEHALPLLHHVLIRCLLKKEKKKKMKLFHTTHDKGHFCRLIQRNRSECASQCVSYAPTCTLSGADGQSRVC